MNSKVLLNSFLVHLKERYPRFKKAEFVIKKMNFTDKFVQRLWEGYQLCYDNFFQEQSGIHAEPQKTVEQNRPISHELALDQPVRKKNIRFLEPNELSTALVNTTVCIIYRNSKDQHEKWIFDTAFINLLEAVELMNEMNIKRRIDLAKWEPYKQDQKQFFLIPNTSERIYERKAHIWANQDTVCRCWLNKAMNPKKYILAERVELGETVICTNCINKVPETNLKFDLKFDSEHRLIDISPK